MNVSELSFCKASIREFRSDAPVRFTWQTPPTANSLLPDEIHLWLADRDVRDSMESCLSVLSEGERAQAAKFRFDLDRQQFAARRAILRHLVGKYLGIAPAGLEFRNDSHGKPQVATAGKPKLQFNLSSTKARVVYAFAFDRRVGIDVEKVRAEVDWEEITRQFFHPRELAAIRQAAAAFQIREFFLYWTMKEAFVKARGTGLDRSLLETDLTPVVREGRKNFVDLDGVEWLFAPIALNPDWQGALVLEA